VVLCGAVLCCAVLCCIWFLAVRISFRSYVTDGTIVYFKQCAELPDVTRVVCYTDKLKMSAVTSSKMCEELYMLGSAVICTSTTNDSPFSFFLLPQQPPSGPGPPHSRGF
jgi:hypothetical protein